MAISDYANAAENDIKHWYLFPILGLLFIVMSFWVIATPAESYLSLSILFSILFLASGICEIVFSIKNKKTVSGWSLVGGILDLLMGLLLLAYPLLSALVLALFVGFGLLFRSVWGIGFAVDLKSIKSRNWGWLLVFALLGIATSFIMLWNPVIAGLTVVALTAFALAVLGVFNIVLGFDLKKLKAILSVK